MTWEGTTLHYSDTVPGALDASCLSACTHCKALLSEHSLQELIRIAPVSSARFLFSSHPLGQEDANIVTSEKPFRQRRYAFYLSGADFPGCAVTYDISKDTLTLWIPIRKPEQIIWFGALPSVEECAARYDVDFVKDITGLQSYLKSTLTPNTTLYVLHESQTPPRPYGPSSGFTVDHSALQPAMDLSRAVKSQYEIGQIREANEISSEAHRYVQRHIKFLTSEAQVENLFIAKCRDVGAKRQVTSELHIPSYVTDTQELTF